MTCSQVVQVRKLLVFAEEEEEEEEHKATGKRWANFRKWASKEGKKSVRTHK